MKKLLFCISLVIASADSSWAQSITVTRNEVQLGDNVIATYAREEIRKPDNTVDMIMTFSKTNGEVIAKAIIPYQQSELKTAIKTEKDNKTYYLKLTTSSDLEMATEIANHLSTNKYL